MGHLFSIVFWASLPTGIASGWLSDRYGVRNIILYSTVLSTLATVFLPPAVVHLPYSAAWCLRALVGVAFGFNMPSAMSTVSRWFPRSERSTVTTMWMMGIFRLFAN